MKKELTLISKFLLVATSACLLAYAAAQADARAADIQTAAAGNPYSAAGAFGVSTSDSVWRDDARKRDVPVRVYVPKLPLTATDKSNESSPTNPAEERFPVLLFSHGLGGNLDGGRIWAEHWASHGFIVIAMQHAGSDESLWKGRPPREIVKSMKAGMTMSNLGLRVGDVRFVIDEVIRRAGIKETPFVFANVKLIGMSGHSFGAQTTLAVSGQKAPALVGQVGLDPRIVAAVAFSPNARNKLNPDRQFGDIRVPFFSVTGTLDGSILDDGTKYEDRMVPHENMPVGGKYLAVFDGGDHMVFGGHTLGARRAETARDREIQGAVKAGTLAFWSATLKGDAAARKWLEGGGFKTTLAMKDTFASK